MPAIKVYVNQKEDEILNKHGNQLIEQNIIQPPFNSYKMGKYIINQFLNNLKEQKQKVNKNSISIPQLEVTEKLKGIIKETEESSNTINQEELDNIDRTNLHEIYAKIRQ